MESLIDETLGVALNYNMKENGVAGLIAKYAGVSEFRNFEFEKYKGMNEKVRRAFVDMMRDFPEIRKPLANRRVTEISNAGYNWKAKAGNGLFVKVEKRDNDSFTFKLYDENKISPLYHTPLLLYKSIYDRTTHKFEKCLSRVGPSR